ncbi:MAG: hypothetical protein GVX78_02720 [Bacteroidetes bacterium]|jgi:diaminopimelate decarboxylase|nr:hypothetical protein [Bacteroidota bacterium]
MKNFRGLFEKAQSDNLIDENDDAIIFYDLEALRSLLNQFVHLLPTNHKPTVAVKTCPLSAVLSEIGENNFGHEAASLSEVLLVAKSSDQLIVYDGPAKEKKELEKLLPFKDRLIINANSLHDLEKISSFTFPNLGLRINPRVTPKVERRFDVSQSGSQFGVPLNFKEEIIEAYSTLKNLNTIHFHLGSGMQSIHPFQKALELVEELAEEIEIARKKNGLPPLSYIDIGGGLMAEPQNDKLLRAAELGELLKNQFAHLWDKYTLITEMGQYFHTHCAWLCTKIADVLHHRDRPILIARSGANMFPRQAYTTVPPPFTYDTLMDSKNRKKTVSYDIAGPLCFAGDRVEEGVLLPKMSTKDWLVVDSVGANTFSLYSMHCSWPFPKVIAYNESQKQIKIIKKRMQVEDIVRFWS